ncbi:MAG: BON domain-containing protein [Gemmatimonadaceae bacterium]
MRDKITHAARETADGIGTTRRDLANRSAGLAAVARRTVQSDDADDDVVAARVRAELGRVVSHPGAIEVSAEQGRVTLHGQVLASEAENLVATVGGVRGVHEVVDHLERHDIAGDTPALQGDGHPANSRFELLQENWSPAARLLAGVAGGALTTAYLRADGRLTPPKAVLGLLGTALVIRSVTNMPFERLIGVGGAGVR